MYGVNPLRTRRLGLSLLRAGEAPLRVELHLENRVDGELHQQQPAATTVAVKRAGVVSEMLQGCERVIML